MDIVSRRSFIKGIAGAGAFLSLPLADKIAGAKAVSRATRSPAYNDKGMKIYVFSKHLQWLDYDGMAQTAAEIGFDGVDLTVRPRGHVLPERATQDLPKAIEAIKKAGLGIKMMTTRITNPQDRHTIPILETAAKLGVQYYRVGSFPYKDNRSIQSQLAEMKPVFRDLAAINKQYEIFGALQNHAGRHYVGAPIWDIWELIKDLDKKWIGCQFDIRHATVEGGLVWPTNFRLICDRVITIVAKDFRWAKTNKGWKTENCPLGEGMVDFPAYFKMVKQAGIPGPISLHLEYLPGGASRGATKLTVGKEEVIQAMRKDLNTLKGWLREAGL